MSERPRDSAVCERFQREVLGAVGGVSAEPGFRHAHLDVCEDCRLEWEALAAIRHREDEPAIAPMDDLAAQRLILDLLAQVDEDPVSEPAETPPEAPSPATRRPARRRSTWAVGIAVAGVVTAVVLVVGLLRRTPATGPVAPRIPPLRLATAELLLRSGAVTPAREGGLIQGDRITVGAGRAAVRIGEAVSLWMGEQSEIEIGATTAGGAQVILHRGEVLVVVTPGTLESGFRLRTVEGVVVVTGTVFAVRRAAPRTVVEVLRGAVRVDSTQRPAFPVTAGRWARVGAPGDGDLPGERRRLLWRRADVLGLLGGPRGARLTLHSQPSEVPVRVDGVALGATPLTVTLRPGHRRLELERPGWIAIREHVLLRADDRLRRDFDLAPAPARRVSKPFVHPGPGRPHAAVSQGTGDGGWRVLLERAQMRRAAQDWRGAAQAYRVLIRRYPGRAEAATARVSLGFIQLEHLGQVTRALRSFDRYLGRGGRGPLAREAAWGRIRCLRRLGRRSTEQREIQRFLKRYPKTIHASRARARLRRISKAPTKRP